MDFKTQAAEEVKGLEARYQALKKEIETLQQESAKIAVQITALCAYLEPAVTPPPPKPIVLPMEMLLSGMENGKRYASVDDIEAVFREAGRPLRAREVSELLDKKGIPIGGKVPMQNLSAKLSGSPRFKQLERGLYFINEENLQPGVY